MDMGDGLFDGLLLMRPDIRIGALWFVAFDINPPACGRQPPLRMLDG